MMSGNLREIAYLVTLVLGVLMACSDPGKQPASQTGGQPVANTALSFAFSKKVPNPNDDQSANWCRIPFPEAAVVNADPSNYDRRFFTLSEGPHRVVVNIGNKAASFILQKSGDVIVIFTSDNFPMCLSNRVNFSIGKDGTSFHYENNRQINFDVQIVSLPNGTQIALEMPPKAGYGILVRR